MSTMQKEIKRIVNEVESLLKHSDQSAERAMPGNTYFLENDDVLALAREGGDSRYPYGQDGFNFWAYASGYMHSNEGLFSLFLRAAEGQEPNISFFAGFPEKDGTCSVESLMPVPKMDAGNNEDVKKYSVLTKDGAYYITTIGALQFALRVFVTADKDICFSLQIDNTSKDAVSFFTSSYLNPYLRHQIYESGEDRWFKEIQIDGKSDDKALSSFIVSVNEDKDRHHSVTNYAVIRRNLIMDKSSKLGKVEESTSRYQFVGGASSSLHTAKALRAGTFASPKTITSFTETAIAGDIINMELAGGDSARLDIVFADMGSDEDAAYLSAKKALSADDIDKAFVHMQKQEAENSDGISITVSDSCDDELKPEVFNRFFEHLKKQVEFCSLLKGYIQLSYNSLIGIRDVFQAIEAYLFWRPEASKRKMLEALDYTSPDGRCFRQYSLPSKNGEVGNMDLRPFIDQGVWVISTLSRYLKVTGDWDILQSKCGYHEIIDEAGRVVRPVEHKDSVLEHMFKIMDYLLKNRDEHKTKCVLALYGDWNDALDGLGISQDPSKAYGTGVSVMATLQVYQNLYEMIDILKHVNAREYAPRIEEYQEVAEEIAKGLNRYAVVQNDDDEKRILHGWGDKRSYLVGSFYDPDAKARDGLTSNAFWVLAGLYEKDLNMRTTILDAFRRLDSKYGYKTFEPAFPPNTHGVGRIGKLPPGTAENGATYVHATTFAIMALFQMGCPKEAWEQIVKILPFTNIHDDNLSHSPFVMPNSYGYNPEKGIDGQNMNDWQTGSSNVVMKMLIRNVFGFEPELDGIWIQPASWCPFKKFEFKINVRGCDLNVTYTDGEVGRRTFTVNGKSRAGTHDNIMGIDKLWIPYEELKKGSMDIVVSH